MAQVSSEQNCILLWAVSVQDPPQERVCDEERLPKVVSIVPVDVLKIFDAKSK